MANNRYTYFNPKLRDNTYQLGDAYDDEKFSGFRRNGASHTSKQRAPADIMGLIRLIR
jgi:hypothetical protein